MNTVVKVVAALIWKDGKFLICQRPAHKARGLLWEFVGGKTEPFETMEQALRRECREELDIGISVGEIFFRVVYEYSDITVDLTVFSAELTEGEPKLLEHADIRWIRPGEIEEYDFCPADEEILRKIRREYAETVAQGIREKLFELQDTEYRDFHGKLMPTVDKDNIIGVRVPQLRKLAKEFFKYPEAQIFMQNLPHRYYEENNLHAFLLEKADDFSEAMQKTESFLPYVDNWATCDGLNPKVFAKDLPRLLERIKKWVRSEHAYTVRFGIGMLMRHYLGSEYSVEYSDLVAEVRSEEYYVKMMIAWYFATALAKQYDAILPYLTEKRLERWVHNKTIQKALESDRITAEQKKFLKTLKIK